MKSLKLLFCLLLAAGVAHADQPVNLDDIVITASRMAQRNYKVPANITVIDSQQIESSGAQTVADILKEAMGVTIYDNSTAKSAVIDIRGFGDTAARNVLVLVNDRKINNVDISGPDLVQIPLEAVERIEVIRGAGSVLYGDNAVGGVVNIITKKGKGDLKGRVGVNYGSYKARSTDLEVSGEKNNISYFAYSKYDDAKGYRANSDALNKDFNTRLGYSLSDILSTDLDIGWHQDNQRLPGGLSDAQLVSLGRRGSANLNDYANTKDRYFKLGFDVKPWPADVEWGKFSIDLDYRNRDVYDAFFSFGEFSTKRNTDTYGITGKYVFDQQVFGKDVNFVTGVDYYDTSNDILGSGTNVDDITILKKEIGIFGYAQYEALKDIYVNAGTRYHQAQYDFHQRNVVVNQSQKPDVWSSTAGLRYDYAHGSNVHLNAQETFRFLATDEWYSTANFPGFGITPGLNLGLDQQTGVQLEAGIKHNFNDAVIVTMTPYQIDLHNEIFFDPVTFANSNYDKTRRRGVEVGQQTDLLKFFSIEKLDKLEFDTNYTYQNAEFLKGSSDGKKIPLVPVNEANASLTVGFLKNYNVALIGHFVGSRFAINDTANATSRIKPYYLMDTKLSYDRKYMEVYLALNNIFDEQYFSYVSKSTFSSTKSYFPAPERNVTVGMSVKF